MKQWNKDIWGYKQGRRSNWTSNHRESVRSYWELNAQTRTPPQTGVDWLLRHSFVLGDDDGSSRFGCGRRDFTAARLDAGLVHFGLNPDRHNLSLIPVMQIGAAQFDSARPNVRLKQPTCQDISTRVRLFKPLRAKDTNQNLLCNQKEEITQRKLSYKCSQWDQNQLTTMNHSDTQPTLPQPPPRPPALNKLTASLWGLVKVILEIWEIKSIPVIKINP